MIIGSNIFPIQLHSHGTFQNDSRQIFEGDIHHQLLEYLFQRPWELKSVIGLMNCLETHHQTQENSPVLCHSLHLSQEITYLTYHVFFE